MCVTMSPLTPFLTETMYGNLRRCLPADAPESVHFQDIPEAAAASDGDPQIVRSVERMQAVIELGRVVRERQNRPLRTPLKRLTVAHSDAAFIADLAGTPHTECCAVLRCAALSPRPPAARSAEPERSAARNADTAPREVLRSVRSVRVQPACDLRVTCVSRVRRGTVMAARAHALLCTCQVHAACGGLGSRS